jgi:glycine/D-amino acid oxidase-like deaminating enzyme
VVSHPGSTDRGTQIWPPLTDNIRCDALVVGAGITGSLVAERLVRQGLNVVIVDREHPGRGSTQASTSMLLWEIDRPLTELTEFYGFERAARVYRASAAAVKSLVSCARWAFHATSLIVVRFILPRAIVVRT